MGFIANAIGAIFAALVIKFIVKTLIPFIRMARAVNQFPGVPFKFPSGSIWCGFFPAGRRTDCALQDFYFLASHVTAD